MKISGFFGYVGWCFFSLMFSDPVLWFWRFYWCCRHFYRLFLKKSFRAAVFRFLLHRTLVNVKHTKHYSLCGTTPKTMIMLNTNPTNSVTYAFCMLLGLKFIWIAPKILNCQEKSTKCCLLHPAVVVMTTLFEYLRMGIPVTSIKFVRIENDLSKLSDDVTSG